MFRIAAYKDEIITPIPANTIRVRTSDGNAPVKANYTSYETATLVAGTTDVYDVYKSGTSFKSLLYKSTNVIEVIGANISSVTKLDSMFNWCTSLRNVALFDTSSATDMDGMFSDCYELTTVPLFNTSKVTRMNSMFDKCSSLTSIPLFDTSKVTNMGYMFDNCSALTSIPLFDTSKTTTITYMFNNCYKVESGALAIYQQVSTQTTPPSSYSKAFTNCGRDTTTGAAELAQIPSSWGGTAT